MKKFLKILLISSFVFAVVGSIIFTAVPCDVLFDSKYCNWAFAGLWIMLGAGALSVASAIALGIVVLLSLIAENSNNKKS